MATPAIPVLVHADESCLGNDRTKPSPGGNAALVEAPAGDSVARWDFYECSPQTTNNRMALAGAIAALEWTRRQWQHALVTYVSDSEYLVKGMREWLPAWKARGWRTADRKPVKNQDLWERLDALSAQHRIKWQWVPGHAGVPGNERVDLLANEAIDAMQHAMR